MFIKSLNVKLGVIYVVATFLVLKNLSMSKVVKRMGNLYNKLKKCTVKFTN